MFNFFKFNSEKRVDPSPIRDSKEELSQNLHGNDNDNVENSQETIANHQEQESVWDLIKSLVSTLLLVLVIVWPIRTFIGKPFIVNGSSMDPSFHSWDYLLVDVFTYKFLHAPERGDVVVFKAPVSNGKYFIKRIIALPGESIEIKNGKVIIYNDEFKEGFELQEDYVSDVNRVYTDMEKLSLGENEYFVMGDNRKGSYDSRYWGPLKFENIVGRAFLRLYPFTQIDLWPAEANYNY